MLQLRKPIIQPEIWKNPIIWAVGFYLFWIFTTSITSTHPIASFKFLVARLWFIIPILIFGTAIFSDFKNVKRFIWLFIIGMMIAILYTLIVHASYRFGEKESHWVMWPFFKDHTIYGAIVALIVPLVFGLYFYKKHSPLVQAIIIGFITITLLGLYFSYTRAAWLSVIAALAVWALIQFKIKFSLIAGIAVIFGGILFFSWDAIQIEMGRNKYEHTTEEFGERLQSATNVTTDASNLERINRWSCAISMYQERPFFGFGPGTYAFEYARFQEPKNLTIISTNFGNMGNAHSEYLGPLAEMGTIGIITMLLIVAAIFYKGITLYNRWPKEDRETRVLLLSMILALSTYFVHAVLNNFLDTDKAAVPIWGMCAIFIALEVNLNRKEIKSTSL
jgi:O-antigen ligase